MLASVGAAAASAVPMPNALTADLDLARPEANLEAYIRLRGDLSGRPVYDMVEGRVYGLVAGEPPRPLFRTLGAGVSRYERVGPLEYTARTRYVGLLTDWLTNRLVQRWINPYTDRPCEVPITRYGPSAMRILSDRIVPAGASTEDTGPAAGRPWYVIGDVVHMVDEVFGAAPREGQPDGDIMTFSGHWSLLADAARTRVPSQLSFTAVEHWRDWMAMKRAGSLLWHVTGVKLDGPADYPAGLLAVLGDEDPAFFDEGLL